MKSIISLIAGLLFSASALSTSVASESSYYTDVTAAIFADGIVVGRATGVLTLYSETRCADACIVSILEYQEVAVLGVPGDVVAGAQTILVRTTNGSVLPRSRMVLPLFLERSGDRTRFVLAYNQLFPGGNDLELADSLNYVDTVRGLMADQPAP